MLVVIGRGKGLGTSRELRLLLNHWEYCSFGLIKCEVEELMLCWIMENTKSANHGGMAEYLTLLYFSELSSTVSWRSLIGTF